MKQLLAAVAVFGFWSAFADEPNTWWVAKEDKNASDELVTERGTEALPFRTIQAALDNPDFVAGDTVLVKPGDYDEGWRVTKVGNYSQTNRLVIAKKVYLKAVEGRTVTRIVGKWGSSSSSIGSGTDGIRCVYVNGGADAVGTVIEGFTLKDGAALGSTSGGTGSRHYCIGGGIYVDDLSKAVYAVDCKFDRCTASTGPAMRGGTAIRCFFDECRSYLGAGVVLSSTYAFACAATRCTQSTTTATAKRYVLDADSVAVNCTFVGNTCRGITNNCGVAYNCMFVDNLVDAYEGSSTNDCFVSAEDGYAHVFATGWDDYRLVTGSGAIGTANAAHRQVLIDLGVPAEYLEKDLSGTIIDWQSDSLNIGAVQSEATPVTATLGFAQNTYVDDVLIRGGSWICSETYPVDYVIRPTDTTKTLFSYTRTAQGSSVKGVRPYFLHPDMKGVMRIMPPYRTLQAYQSYTVHYAAAEIWVDPTDAGSDENGDGTAAKPYHTLQKAFDSVKKDYTLIRARRGDYKEGGSKAFGLMTRVNMYTGSATQNYVLLRAEEGPAVTAIWGAADETALDDPNEPGCGPDAVRCLALNAQFTQVQGFTLRDGHTRGSAESGDDVTGESKSGAVAYGLDNFWRVPSLVMDCVITNCVSGDVLVRNAYTLRDYVVGNVSTGPIFDLGFHAADLVVGNKCSGIYGKSSGNTLRSYLMTCVGNEKSPGATAFNDWAAGDLFFGSIFVNGRVATESDSDICNVVWKHTTTSKLSKKSVVGDPIFADEAAGDYRPAAGGAAVDFADPLQSKGVTEYVTEDFYGDPLRVSADGKLTAGCIQQNLPCAIVVSGAKDAGLLVNGQSGAALTNVVEQGASVELTISGDATTPRWAKGYTLNGVEHLFDAYPGVSEKTTFAFAETGYRIDPILSTEWYVDATDGNDARGGFTAATAKKTLAEVVTNCAVAAGDTIYALPGTYDRGAMLQTDDAAIMSRVIVPESVTLKATGSAEETVIVGEDSPEPIGSYGQGTNAVRCVALRANAVVDGFTLTGGRTATKGALSSSKRDPNGCGAGVYGISEYTSPIARNCIISNNVAAYGGGGAGASYVKCRFFNNRATDSGDGGALYRPGSVNSCVFDGNYGNYCVMYPSGVYGCTFGDNHGNRSVYYYQPSAGAYKTFNSVIYHSGNDQSIFWNCVVYTNSKFTVSAAKLAAGNSIGVAKPADLKLDEGLRPEFGSPLIDAGDDENRGNHFPETDLDGVPRVLNGGCFDIGAFEYDWRVDYAKDLGKRIVVTDVSSNVVETADGKVEIPEGFLKLDWQSKGKPLVFKAQVAGEGALAVNVNGEPFVTLTESDEPEVRIPETLDLTKLEFVFTGSGSATLADFRRDSGALLIVR